MNSRNVLVWLLATCLMALAVAARADEEFRIPKIPGLELVRGATTDLPNKIAPIAFRFKDGRICIYGGKEFSYYSSDNGKTWEKGPVGALSKMMIDLGNGEILSISGNMIPQKDGK